MRLPPEDRFTRILCDHGCLDSNFARVPDILILLSFLPQFRQCFLHVVEAFQGMVSTFYSFRSSNLVTLITFTLLTHDQPNLRGINQKGDFIYQDSTHADLLSGLDVPDAVIKQYLTGVSSKTAG